MRRISLSFLNFIRRPKRTIALIVLSVLLSFSVLSGALVISGLKTGLNSLEERLGADIMVVPYEAATKSSLDDMILQGNPGYFYMSKAKGQDVLSVEGIGQASDQFYLASSTASCCSYKVQLIGFNEDTDFTITPWIDQSSDKKDSLDLMEVYVGCSLNAFVGDEITFYDTKVKVAGRLDQTGTYLDTAVYGSEETIKELMAAAKEKQIYNFGDVNPDDVVSCILINVADGYTVEDVLNNINLHVKGVTAVRTQNMISDVSSKLTGVTEIAGALIGVVWVLMIGIMIVAFAMIVNERRKEFAVYRVLGASRSKIASIIFGEAFYISILGAVTGAIFAIALSKAFTSMIETTLGLPYLMPSVGTLVLITVAAIVATVLAATISAAVSAIKISKIDAALTLRGEN